MHNLDERPIPSSLPTMSREIRTDIVHIPRPETMREHSPSPHASTVHHLTRAPLRVCICAVQSARPRACARKVRVR
eukprot:6203619-Pleurochrysis_carterae.AAC.2